ncbi:hypothetical protein ABPG72_001695 [Tetrahymena utriculariae]
MKKLINLFQIVGWSYVIIDVIFNILEKPEKFLDTSSENTFSRAIFVMRIVQTAQFIDFIQSSGNIVSVVAQYLGRMIVAWLYMSEVVPTCYASSVLLAWSTADIIRYLYYTSKSDIVAFFRYNAFLILYPAGVFLGEVFCIQYTLAKLNPTSDFYDIQYYLGKFVQVAVCIGMPLLYAYLLKVRSKFYSKRESIKQVKPAKTQQKRD